MTPQGPVFQMIEQGQEKPFEIWTHVLLIMSRVIYYCATAAANDRYRCLIPAPASQS